MLNFLTSDQIFQEVNKVCTLSETDPFIKYENMTGSILFSNNIKFKCQIVKGYVYAFNNCRNMKNIVSRFIHYTNKQKCFLINILADSRYELIIRDSEDHIFTIYISRSEFISYIKIYNDRKTFVITLPYFYE